MTDKRFSQRGYRSIRSLSVDSFEANEVSVADPSYASSRIRLYKEVNGLMMYDNPTYTGNRFYCLSICCNVGRSC